MIRTKHCNVATTCTYIAMVQVYLYLGEFLMPRHFFFITIMVITKHAIKLMMTTADTIIGIKFEVGGKTSCCSITVRIILYIVRMYL